MLRAIARGGRYVEAAADLGVSVNTLRQHLRHVYRKLGVTSRAEAVRRAEALGLGACDPAGPKNRMENRMLGDRRNGADPLR